jgi:MFS family permease
LVWWERRVVEPIVPMRLFSNRVFRVTAAIGFVMGFAMFGAATFIPLFFQIVKGATATQSGLLLLPLMVGLFLASVAAGQLTTRSGRYRIFPILGTGIMALGLALTSMVGVDTDLAVILFFLALVGIGIGLVNQVLVLAVQNAVPYAQLGTATSGVTFFRSIGGSFGTAILGAVFANVMVDNVAQQLHGAPVPLGAQTHAINPTVVAHLPPALHAGFVNAVAQSIQTIFICTIPVALVAFALSWRLPELELRTEVQGAGLEDGALVDPVSASR